MTMHHLLSSAGLACLTLLAVPAAQAQISVTEGPGSHFTYVYNPLEAGQFPAEAIETEETQLGYIFEEEFNTSYLSSVPSGEASVTWHFQLTEPGAVWSGDVRVKADVLMIADALADRWSNYWLLEYSTDGVNYAPFLSTYAGDSAAPYFWPGEAAHSGRGPFFLDRGGFEGGGSDLYIRVKAVNNSAPSGDQMQAFRTDTDNNRQFEVIGSIVGAGEADAVTISTQEAVALGQSGDDDLKDNVGEMSGPLHVTSAGGPEAFTNATSATEFSGNIFWHPDNTSYHITWDLGEVDSSVRQLDEISVWIDAHDDGRRGYRGVFYTSMDNIEFRQVPGTAYGDVLAQGGTGASPLFNNVRYTFNEGSVVGFRYLRFVSHGKQTQGDYVAQTRFVEIDAWFSTQEQTGGFASWRGEHFPNDSADDSVSGPAADPDGDGMSNLVEYALGLDPKAANRDGLPMVGLENVGGDDYLTLSFRRPDAISDIDYAVTLSGDLGSWAAGAVAAGQTAHGDGTTTYTFRDSQPISQEERRFMRLQVTQAQ